MRVWQENALRRVYSALREIPGGGTGVGGSSTVRSLAVSVRCSNTIRGPAMAVLESLASRDDRATVTEWLSKLDDAVVESRGYGQ